LELDLDDRIPIQIQEKICDAVNDALSSDNKAISFIIIYKILLGLRLSSDLLDPILKEIATLIEIYTINPDYQVDNIAFEATSDSES